MNRYQPAIETQSSTQSLRNRKVAAWLATLSVMVGLWSSLPAQQTDAKASLEKTLETTRRNAMAAWQQKDAEALKATMASDFHFVSPQGVALREGWLASLSHCSLTSYTMDHVQVQTIAPDSAVMIFRLHYVGDCDGTPVPPESIVVDSFALRGGKWWIVNTAYMPYLPTQ